MKRISTILLSLSALCMLAACEVNNLDPLTGEYDITRYNFSSVSVGETEVTDNVKILSVGLSDGSNSMNITFGSSSYVLPATTYVHADEITGAKQYIATINGTSVVDGDIDVVLSGDTYYFTSYMTDASGKQFIMKYKGSIEFDDPTGGAIVPTDLVNLLSASSNVLYGTNSVTVVIATEDVHYGDFDWSTWSYPIEGEGNYISIDFYSSDGYLYAGTYTPADSDSMASGKFLKGYDPGDIYGWGIEYTNWGTCWFTVENGATTGEHVEDGTIEVSLSGDTYTITLTSSVANAVYTGPIDDLNPNK